MSLVFNPFTGTFDFTGSSGGGGGTISGTIADTQVAFGTAADTIGGSSNLTWDGTTFTVALDSHFGPAESTLPPLLRGYVGATPNLIVATLGGSTPALGIETVGAYALFGAIQGQAVSSGRVVGNAFDVYAGGSGGDVWSYGGYRDANGFAVNKLIGFYAYAGSLSGGTATDNIAYFNQNATNVAGVGHDFSWYSEGGTLHVETGDGAYVGLEIFAAGGQTAHLTNWFNASDPTSPAAFVDAAGIIQGAGYQSSDGTAGVTTTDFKNGLYVGGVIAASAYVPALMLMGG